MLKYNRFNLNRILESLINESMFYYTTEFSDILHKMDNDIAKELLKLRGTDVKPDMTFIDVDKEGFVTFSQIDKAISGIKKSIDEFINDPDIDSDSAIKYRNKTISDIKSGNWDGSFKEVYDMSRNTIKLGKLVNSIFPGKYSAKEIESFVNSYKTKSINEKKFELVEGDDIKHWYDEDNYFSEDGSLGSSCMRHSYCSDYLDIYSDNIGICRLLILKDNDDDLILGRALVWKISYTDDSDLDDFEYFMDRVYICNDIYHEDFIEYAISKNWMYRKSQGYNTDVHHNGESYGNVRLEVQLNKYNFGEFPYMDTFVRLDVSDGILYNDDNRESGCYILQGTSGEYTNCDDVWSDYYDEYIPEVDSVYSEPLNTYIYKDMSVKVEHGHYSRLGYYPDNYDSIIQDEYRDIYIHMDDYAYSEYDNMNFFCEDMVSIIIEFDNCDNYKIDDTSSYSDKIIDIGDMACEEYLKSNSFEYQRFHDDLVSKSNDKYYFIKYKIELFKTDKGYLSELDCDILNIKKGNISYKTDKFAYNFKLKEDSILDSLKAKCLDKIEYYKDGNDIPGTQTKLKFDDSDDYQVLVDARIKEIEKRIDIIEEFL